MEEFNMKLVFIACICFGLNFWHTRSMFENANHFSHLSNLEREMIFRTEMGFYYSFYKRIVEANTFTDGALELLHESKIEYPDMINALERFNLLPEILLSGAYHMTSSVYKYFGSSMPKTCYQVSRENMSPVLSCEGFGEPIYWYLNGVWFSAGMTSALLFISGVQLSGSFLGGFITIICFFYNHGEATRVQWAPPLRENFAFPYSLLLNIILTKCLSNEKCAKFQPIFFGILGSLYLLTWQFGQFTLVAQLAFIYGLYTVGLVPAITMLLTLIGCIYAVANSLILQFFNYMLITSILGATILAIFLLHVFLEPWLEMLPKPTNMSAQLGFFFISAIACKIELSRFFGVSDDNHIFDIMKSKFTNYSDFHTSLYTCSKEFDFLPFETFQSYMETLLLPCVLLVTFLFIYYLFTSLKKNLLSRVEEFEKNRKVITSMWKGIDAALVFNFCMLGFYAIIATFIMRLKLFLTPHMCVISSLISSHLLKKFFAKKDLFYAIIVFVIAMMGVRGIKNLEEQRKIVGEFSDQNLEEMLEWINKETSKNSVFAGPMSVMGNVILSTGRPVVNHPHYENETLRERTKKIYSISSRNSVKDVYATLLSLKVDYVIIQESWCFRKSHKNGCSMVEIWDLENPEMSNRPALCPKLFYHDAPPFQKVFSNEEFVILQVPSKYVELKRPLAHSS